LKVEPVEKVRRYKSNWLQHDGWWWWWWWWDIFASICCNCISL
jgi:hypothetical protein